jgi:FkbM family methyltransferase
MAGSSRPFRDPVGIWSDDGNADLRGVCRSPAGVRQRCGPPWRCFVLGSGVTEALPSMAVSNREPIDSHAAGTHRLVFEFAGQRSAAPRSDMNWRLPVGTLARTMPRGRTRVAHWLRRHPGSTEVAYVDLTGLRRRADLRDRMEGEWFTGAKVGLEREVVDQVPRGSWTVDVGANIGIVTGQLAKRTNAAVWALEPSPSNVARLTQLATDNAIPVTVFPVAAGASDGSIALGLPAAGESGWASITASWLDTNRIQVPMRSIDSLVDEFGAPGALSFIKIDVEGYEAEVLDGARRTLARYRPRLYVEFNDIILRDRGSSSADLLGLFADVGYSPSMIPELTGRVVNLLLDAVG